LKPNGEEESEGRRKQQLMKTRELDYRIEKELDVNKLKGRPTLTRVEKGGKFHEGKKETKRTRTIGQKTNQGFITARQQVQS